MLLTRTRQGIVVFVPPGDAGDSTRNPVDYDRAHEHLHQIWTHELA